MSQTDWLDMPAAEPDWLDISTVRDALPDYLKIPELDTPSTEITVKRADAAEQNIRFEVMRGTDRTWACNGRYVACRPSAFANPAITSRHNRFLQSGHYRHVGTFDDVQLFELTPSSPWYRTPGDARAGSFYELLRAAAQAAVARDWGAYVDLLEEIAVRVKSTAVKRDTQGGVDTNWASDQFHSTLDHLEQLIFMRWTHGQILVEDKDYKRGGKAITRDMAVMAMKLEIDAGVSQIRAARGEKQSGRVARPRGPLIIR